MRNALCIVAGCFLSQQAFAQFNLEFHSGYAQYSNSALKTYQAQVADNYFVDGKVLESFPSFWYYGVDMKWNFPASQVGLSISRGSTGGQVYYADYSGTFREQQMLKYTSVRMLTAARMSFNNGKTFIMLDPRFGLAFATLDVDRSIKASGGTQSVNDQESARYKAVNPFIEPTFSIAQRFGPVNISAFVGYHYDVAFSIYRQSNGTPMTDATTEVRMNLSGVRAGGTIGFYIARSKEEEEKDEELTRLYLSLGAGLDFGGIAGLNAMWMLREEVGLFGGVGYALDKVGMNGGLRIYGNKQTSKVRPFFSAMYGYNAVFIVKNDAHLNRTFYGTTVGLGMDVKLSRPNFWTIAVQLPFRNDDVKAYKTYLKNSNVKLERDLLPVAFSIGYRFGIVK